MIGNKGITGAEILRHLRKSAIIGVARKPFKRCYPPKSFLLLSPNIPLTQADESFLAKSLGGQFVLYSAFTDPNLFWGRISSNPALHRNLNYFLNLSIPGNQKTEKQSSLIVTSAENDDERFQIPRSIWIEHWRSNHPTSLKITNFNIENHGHFSAVTESFRLGMKCLFNTDKNTTDVPLSPVPTK